MLIQLAAFFGSQRLAFYNESYATLAGRKHPEALGQPFNLMWEESRGARSLVDILDTAFASGQSAAGDDMCFVVDRYGFREEIHVSWAITPMLDSHGTPFAFYVVVVDHTQRQISDRHLTTLLSLSQSTASARNTEEFWTRLLQGFRSNDADVPFAVLYSLDVEARDKHGNEDSLDHVSSPMNSKDSRTWLLQGSMGLDADFDGLPRRMDSCNAAAFLTTAYDSAMTSDQPILLTVEDGTFPKILQGVARSRRYGDPCQKAVMFCLRSASHCHTLGFMILGLDPLTKYDSAYQRFIEHLARQCTTSFASLLGVADESHRTQLAIEAAMQDRINLSAKLAEQQKEINDRDVRFRAMADLAPVGMFHLDEHGTVLYANKRWLDITQQSQPHWQPMSWMDAIYPDDVKLMEEQWQTVLKGEPINFELRFKTSSQASEDGTELEPEPTWTIMSAYAEKRSDQSVKGCLGCVTDITRQKWMEGLQQRRMEEALELKKQQEDFMDMTSHEARNPLAAIMLCAESCVTTIKELLETPLDHVAVPKDVMKVHLESAEIILTCAQHQKRIMDDVLTLSKLNSGLLVVCPVATQPISSVYQALKMVDAEVQKHDIAFTLDVDKSFETLAGDWFSIDPSRLLQILINLLTNAIKFTKGDSEKLITLTLSTTSHRPFTSLHGVSYVEDPESSTTPPPAQSNQVFLGFEISDSGPGLTQEEMERLFQKFQQASPKTHIEYGGSGLGLYISRQLCRMQGGSIGVASSGNGKGATFAFFIPALRCAAPKDPEARRSSATAVGLANLDATGKPKRPAMQSARPLTAHRSQLRKGHILVVEDNLINQKVIRMQLERLGYTVSVANHGLEALDHVLKSRFCTDGGKDLDVVLLDIEMPVCDGAECARRIRAMEQSGQVKAHIPIVGITANARTEQQLIAIEAGMDVVVTKPFRLMELSAELERVPKLFAEESEGS